MEKKPWEKPGSVGGPVFLWPGKTSMAYLNYRLQHRPDCAEDSSGSLGLVPLAVLAWPQRDLSLWSIQLTWSQLTFRAVEVISRCWCTICSCCGLDLGGYGDLGIRMKETNISTLFFFVTRRRRSHFFPPRPLLYFPCLLSCLVTSHLLRDSLCIALQTEKLWIWSTGLSTQLTPSSWREAKISTYSEPW